MGMNMMSLSSSPQWLPDAKGPDHHARVHDRAQAEEISVGRRRLVPGRNTPTAKILSAPSENGPATTCLPYTKGQASVACSTAGTHQGWYWRVDREDVGPQQGHGFMRALTANLHFCAWPPSGLGGGFRTRHQQILTHRFENTSMHDGCRKEGEEVIGFVRERAGRLWVERVSTHPLRTHDSREAQARSAALDKVTICLHWG